MFLQKLGRTGQLTTISVKPARKITHHKYLQFLAHWDHFGQESIPALIPYMVACLLTIIVLIMLGITEDWWGFSVIVALMFSRLCNVIVVRRRIHKAGHWKGASEPGVQGDLLILLSQDRWIRLKGAVDDLKAVTSGQWLAETTFMEGAVTAFATLLVYLDAALASNTEMLGKILLLGLLITSAGLLALANESTDVLQMHDRLLRIDGKRVKYERRLDMAKELIRQSKREDWAVRLGMIVKELDNPEKTESAGVTM